MLAELRMTMPNTLNTMIMEMLQLIAFKNYGITATTVIKGAWALVLAEVAATPDVVYGHTVLDGTCLSTVLSP